jgi:putative hydrolase of the HAD superfamily
MIYKNNKIKWIMFDMGNVLVKYQPQAYKIFAENHNINIEKAREVLINEDVFLKSGKGEIMEDEFIKIMEDAFGVELTTEEVIETYSHEIKEVIDGIEDILKVLKKDYRLSILSNTFFAHWNYFKTTPLHGMFDLPMASHILREIKPDEAIYRKALSKMRAKPNEVIFIDDLEENIEAAKEIGINAFQSLTIEDTKRGLVELGVLDEEHISY